MKSSQELAQSEEGLQYKDIDSLIKASQFGDYNFLETAFREYNISPNIIDKDGCSLLHWSAINGRENIVELLLKRDANINIIGGENLEIPLQWAVRQKNEKVIHLLISNHSDLHHKSAFGYDALYLAVQAGHLNNVFLLLYSGANPNTVDLNNETPLFWLLRNDPNNNGIEMIRLLIKFKADVLHKDREGNNALHILALDGRNFDNYKAFIIYSVNPDIIAKEENNEGKTVHQLILKTKNTKIFRFLFDAYCYFNYPKYIPICISAAIFCSFFLFLEQIGWYYFLLAYFPVYLISEMFTQSSIVIGTSRMACGFAWGIIITVTSSYYIYLSKYFSLYSYLLISLLACLIIYTFSKSINSCPACLVDDGDNSRAKIYWKIVNNQDENFRLCTTCLTDKSLASMHCSKCNKCIIGLDHHCPFVNNCVAKGNRRIFVYFTLFASLGCFVLGCHSLYAEHKVFCSDVEGWMYNIFAVQTCMFTKYRALPLITWLAFVTSMWIFFIFLGQIGFVASETTTYEMLKRDGRKKVSVKIFSMRGFKNIITFCLTGQYITQETSSISNKSEFISLV